MQNTKINALPTVGAGAVADALAKAGVFISAARQTMGAGVQSIGELLRSGERPAGPLLAACQAQLDREQCERQAFRLNSKMVADGRASLWMSDTGKGAGWCATMADAISDAIASLALWRSGQSLRRDDTGADVISLGDVGGNVCGAWVTSHKAVPVMANESTAQAVAGYWDGRGGAVKTTCHLAHTASRIAWRSMVASIARDTFGESEPQVAVIRDYVEYECGARDRRGLTPEQRTRRRLSNVEAMHGKLASGQGRRGALADKVKQAAILMLSGMGADAAAAAAGFKGAAARGRGGAVAPSMRLAAALRRAGLRVTAKRGAWSQVVDEFEGARRRGAAVDLAQQWHGVPRAAALEPVTHPARAGKFCGQTCLLAAVIRGSVRRKRGAGIVSAISGRGVMASASVDLATLPASLVTLRRVVKAASRRKLRGVLRGV